VERENPSPSSRISSVGASGFASSPQCGTGSRHSTGGGIGEGRGVAPDGAEGGAAALSGRGKGQGPVAGRRIRSVGLRMGRGKMETARRSWTGKRNVGCRLVGLPGGGGGGGLRRYAKGKYEGRQKTIGGQPVARCRGLGD